MCCMRLARNTGPPKIATDSPFAHNRTTLSSYIFATKARIDNRKKLVKQQYLLSSTCPHNIVNFGPITTEICWRVWGTPANFNGFRVLAALLHGTLVVASAKLCGVEQRAPPIFGRVAITLGIGPHSSYICSVNCDNVCMLEVASMVDVTFSGSCHFITWQINYFSHKDVLCFTPNKFHNYPAALIK